MTKRIVIPAPNWSFTKPGDDLGGAPRWVVFLAKIAQGILIAAVFAFGVALHLPLQLIGACAFAYVLMTIVSNVAGGYNYKPFHWLTDFALAMMWAGPGAWFEWHNPWLAAAPIILFLATYARGAE